MLGEARREKRMPFFKVADSSVSDETLDREALPGRQCNRTIHHPQSSNILKPRGKVEINEIRDQQ
jgi:hypothetical protein